MCEIEMRCQQIIEWAVSSSSADVPVDVDDGGGAVGQHGVCIVNIRIFET